MGRALWRGLRPDQDRQTLGCPVGQPHHPRPALRAAHLHCDRRVAAVMVAVSGRRCHQCPAPATRAQWWRSSAGVRRAAPHGGCRDVAPGAGPLEGCSVRTRERSSRSACPSGAWTGIGRGMGFVADPLPASHGDRMEVGRLGRPRVAAQAEMVAAGCHRSLRAGGPFGPTVARTADRVRRGRNHTHGHPSRVVAYVVIAALCGLAEWLSVNLPENLWHPFTVFGARSLDAYIIQTVVLFALVPILLRSSHADRLPDFTAVATLVSCACFGPRSGTGEKPSICR